MILVTHQPLRFWLKALAKANIPLMLVTLLVSQLLMFWLKATASDREVVLRLNAAGVPGVALLDAEEFHRLCGLPNLHLICKGADGLPIGYLLAFSSGADYDGEEFRAFETATAVGSPFVYVDQVVVEPLCRRTRVASALYRALEVRAEAMGIAMVCCEVNLEPANPASISFHAQCGFAPLSTIATADGRRVVLMTKELRAPSPVVSEVVEWLEVRAKRSR